MTDELDELTEQITDRAADVLREQLDDARRNDLGKPRGRLHDPTNAATDDRGNRKRRPRGISDRKARDALQDLEEGAVESRGARPYEQDSEDGSKDVDPRIDEVADTEGW